MDGECCVITEERAESAKKGSLREFERDRNFTTGPFALEWHNHLTNGGLNLGWTSRDVVYMARSIEIYCMNDLGENGSDGRFVSRSGLAQIY